jgi:uncharacterized protein YjiS (DUF1127 family)
MTSNTETHSTAVHPWWLAIVAVAGFATMRISRLVKAIRHRRDVEMLAAFDDRMLADIGLNRSDLRFALSEPFWRDPAHVLVIRAGERRFDRRGRGREPTTDFAAPSIVPDLVVPARLLSRRTA